MIYSLPSSEVKFQTDAGMQIYDLKFTEHQHYPYVLRRSKRAERMTIRIRHDLTMEVVLPWDAAEQDGHNFIARESAWVCTTMKKIQRKISHTKASKKQVPQYLTQLPFRLTDTCYPVRYEWCDVPWVGARALHSPAPRIEVSGRIFEQKQCASAMAELVRRMATSVLPPMLESLAERHGFHYERVGIRLQRRRWGSCSSSGAISLNALLLFFPRDMVEYVLIHELCHLRVMNHSKSFWSEVWKYCPDYLSLRKRMLHESRNMPELDFLQPTGK